MPSTGTLISFEGGEGGGKTTQIALLRERLLQEGHEAIQVREPGGTSISEQIRDVVLSTKNQGMSFTTEVLLFQAARAQVYNQVVLPALAEGKIVLMDRTRDSSVVYQGAVRGFGKEAIEDLNAVSTHDTFPKMTFLLDLPTQVGLDRKVSSQELNRFEHEQNDFHERVREEYLSLAKEDQTGRWVVIDASQPIEKVAELIWQKVEELLKKAA